MNAQHLISIGRSISNFRPSLAGIHTIYGEGGDASSRKLVDNVVGVIIPWKSRPGIILCLVVLDA